MKISSFTQICSKEERCLTTLCGASEAFDPQKRDKNFPHITQYKSIWDTGAMGIVVTKNVIERLKLQPIRPIHVETASGPYDTFAYLINLYLPNNILIPGVWVSEGKIVDADILIGMDVISRGDFAISSSDKSTKFTFQMPSNHNTDYVYEAQLIDKYQKIHVEWIKHGNNRCPCGSGKQWNQCHGK